MKEITRIVTMQVTKIMKVSDEEAEKIVAYADGEKERIQDSLYRNGADDVNVEIKDFVRDNV